MQNLASITILPVLGWIVSAVLALLLAIPLYVLWSWLGPTYFYFVPTVYLKIGFLDMAGLLVLIGFLKLTFLPSSWNVK